MQTMLPFFGTIGWQVAGVDEAVEERAEHHNMRDGRDGRDLLELGLQRLQAIGHISVEERPEDRLVVGVVPFGQPGGDVGRPADILHVDVEDARPGHGRRRRSPQRGDLEQQPHARRQRDPLIARQRQHFVVVHHGIQRFNPHGVDVPVHHHPLRPVARQRRLVTNQNRK